MRLRTPSPAPHLFLALPLALLLAWSTPPAWAQDHVDHASHAASPGDAADSGDDTADEASDDEMDHEGMDMGEMNHDDMDHGAMDHEEMDHGAMGHEGMDMGEMDMGGMPASAPPDNTRDPHAYSGGYTLHSGPYLLPGLHPVHTADTHSFATLLVDRLERVDARGDSFTAWDAQASVGRDFDKLVFKTEGDAARGRVEAARNELLWSHAVANFWDAQIGWRHDTGEAPDQDWLAVGVQGLAPYWFELSATAYLGEGGQSALRLDGEYEMRLTQRLILQPKAEFTAYGRQDARRGVGAGPAELTAGLRLRYEVTRQFAPYVGVEWQRLMGETADLAREDGRRAMSARWAVGVRIWF